MLILINKKQENEALIVKLWHLKKGSFMKYRDPSYAVPHGLF